MNLCACRDCLKPVKANDNNLELCRGCAGCDEWGKSDCRNPNYVAPKVFGRSGYTPCACRDCMDIAVSNDMSKPDLCLLCRDAGCDTNNDCRRPYDVVGFSRAST